jgi:hypothetical protein
LSNPQHKSAIGSLAKCGALAGCVVVGVSEYVKFVWPPAARYPVTFEPSFSSLIGVVLEGMIIGAVAGALIGAAFACAYERNPSPSMGVKIAIFAIVVLLVWEVAAIALPIHTSALDEFSSIGLLEHMLDVAAGALLFAWFSRRALKSLPPPK